MTGHLDAVIVEGRFADPTMASQATFRAVMAAMARPGTIQSVAVPIATPPRLSPACASVFLTLCDADTPVWIDAANAADGRIERWLAFQTGAPLTDVPETAAFALIAAGLPPTPLAGFGIGTDTYPDRSTTVIVAVDTLRDGPPLTLRGPGIRDRETVAPAPLPDTFLADWTANGRLFPRGVDVILAADDAVAALPRTTRIAEAGA